MTQGLCIVDPRSGRLVASVPRSSLADTASAVQHAVGARDSWAATDPSERAHLVGIVTSAWESRASDLLEAVVQELGQPERFTRQVHVENPLRGARVMAELARDVEWTRQVESSTIERRGVGVVAALTPWNYPVHQAIAKVVAGLLAGCPVVVKPSEFAPRSTQILVEAAIPHLPDGVLGIVQGDGLDVGAALVADERVDLVSFTGSAAVGRQVAAAAAAAGTPTHLELGGRSPAVLLEDLDASEFARAVRFVVADAMSNAGQTCNALSRLVVPRRRVPEAIDAATHAARRLVPGKMLGPLRSAEARQRVVVAVAEAERRGVRVVVDGRHTKHPDDGFWLGPTLLVVDDPTDPIVTDEVFGPVLTVQAYDERDSHGRTDDAASAVANGPSLGLAAAVWAADPQRAERVASHLRAGQVRIAGAPWDFRLPFGGFGSAGWGREWGRAGIEALTTTRVTVR